jgi:hypothetical protein
MGEAETGAMVVAPSSELQLESRGALIREALVFGLKLGIDGLKDVVLAPITMFALALDLMKPTPDGGKNLRRVFRLGHGFDQWLDLFKVGRAPEGAGRATQAGFDAAAGGFDDQLDGVEKLLRDELATGQLSGKAKAALRDLLAKSGQAG